MFRGRYHVLGGVIDPIHGVGPDQLNIASLMSRLADGTVTEVILATNPNVEGEATAAYLARMLSTMGVETSRLANGPAHGRGLGIRGLGDAGACARGASPPLGSYRRGRGCLALLVTHV